MIFKGGAVVEVFSAQGKDPVAKWKLSGQPSISKVRTAMSNVSFVSVIAGIPCFLKLKTTVA